MEHTVGLPHAHAYALMLLARTCSHYCTPSISPSSKMIRDLPTYVRRRYLSKRAPARSDVYAKYFLHTSDTVHQSGSHGIYFSTLTVVAKRMVTICSMMWNMEWQPQVLDSSGSLQPHEHASLSRLHNSSQVLRLTHLCELLSFSSFATDALPNCAAY